MSLHFLDSAWENLGPLQPGVTSVVLADDVVNVPRKLVSILSRDNVTRITVVPSLLRTILDLDMNLQARLTTLTQWSTSAEVLTAQLLLAFRSRLPEATLLNLAGSSEVAADVPSWEADRKPESATVSMEQTF